MGYRFADYSKIDQQRKYLVMHKIKELKNLYFEQLKKDGYDVEEGRRFADNENIFKRMISALWYDSINSIEEANTFFLKLNPTEITTFIYTAVKDAAGADYWYKYEKQWD